MNEDFYITLTSSVKDYQFKNETSDFVTELEKYLTLGENYEVGISNIFLPSSIINIHNENKDYNIKFYFFLENRNLILLKNEFIPSGIYSKDNLVNTINDLWLDRIKAHSDFKIIKNNYISFFLPEYYIVQFSKALSDILGFKKTNFVKNTKRGKFTSENKINLYKNHSGCFIYSDIVDYSHIGQKQGNLLGVIPLDDEKKLFSMHTFHFDKPHYVKVIKNNFKNIRIFLKNEREEKLKFALGEILLRLHFRKIKDGKY